MADFQLGESLVGDGNEIAHIDLLIGSKDGPVGVAFANALARQSEGHSNLLAVLTPHLAVTIVEGKPMDTGKIAVVKSGEMQEKLARDGRVAIYGIYFDFDKSEIKPESREQIEQPGIDPKEKVRRLVPKPLTRSTPPLKR